MNRLIALFFCMLIALSAQAVDTSAPAARTIVLVRHGNYIFDPSIPENPGPHLSALGLAQARLAGARLVGMPVHFDAMLVSPMQRARDTAAEIGGSFPGRTFEVVDDLAECTPPTRRAEVTARMDPAELEACKARLDRVFAKYFVPATGHEAHDLFVCHGNVIRYLVTRALGVDTKTWLEMSVGHASLTTIRVEADGSFKVIAIGDVGHIPPDLRSGATGDMPRALEIPVK